MTIPTPEELETIYQMVWKEESKAYLSGRCSIYDGLAPVVAVRDAVLEGAAQSFLIEQGIYFHSEVYERLVSLKGEPT